MPRRGACASLISGHGRGGRNEKNEEKGTLLASSEPELAYSSARRRLIWQSVCYLDIKLGRGVSQRTSTMYPRLARCAVLRTYAQLSSLHDTVPVCQNVLK